MDCCATWDDNPLIADTNLAHARLDAYPVADGHSLVIPYRHVLTFAELTPAELVDLHFLICHIQQTSDADDFTIGINDGIAAGRTVHHLHMHVIPRRLGDVPDPRGGVRRVLIPDVRQDPLLGRIGHTHKMTPRMVELLTDVVRSPTDAMYIRRCGDWDRTAQALVRRGLVAQRDVGMGQYEITLTPTGQAEADRRGVPDDFSQNPPPEEGQANGLR